MPLSCKTTGNKVTICAIISINLSASRESTARLVSFAEENDHFVFVYLFIFFFQSHQFLV